LEQLSLWVSFHARACSLPPEPSNKMFILRCYSCAPKFGLVG
jgi:hypothetical protein